MEDGCEMPGRGCSWWLKLKGTAHDKSSQVRSGIVGYSPLHCPPVTLLCSNFISNSSKRRFSVACSFPLFPTEPELSHACLANRRYVSLTPIGRAPGHYTSGSQREPDHRLQNKQKSPCKLPR